MIFKLFITVAVLALTGVLTIKLIGKTKIPSWLEVFLVVSTVVSLVALPILAIASVWVGIDV